MVESPHPEFLPEELPRTSPSLQSLDRFKRSNIQGDIIQPPLFSEDDFPPLDRDGHNPVSPPSPVISPSFFDPSLKKTLNIFSNKSPLSPSVLPLESIRFENVTIRKKKSKKPSKDVKDSMLDPYIPLSTRLKAVDSQLPSPPPRALRAQSPFQIDS